MVLDMLSYFGKIFAGGFFRTLGKIFAFILVGIVIAFLVSYINIGNAKADSSFTFFNNAVTGVSSHSTSTGNLVFSRTPDNVSGKSFLFVDVCANSSFDIEVVSNTTGLIYPLGKSYLTNKSCKLINGYMGNVYRFIFIIGSFGYTQADYIIDGSNSSDIEFGTLTTAYLRSQIKVTSIANYYSYFNFYDYGISDTPPLEDLIYENDLNQTAILRDILNTLKEISVSSNAGVTEAINNQTKKIEEQIQKQEETNQKLDEVNNTMKDDSVDNNQASGFFDNFDNIDHGGISGVITAPLSAINKINQPCSAININLWDKDITLPCGDTLFWNKESVSSFRGVWNILVGGPIIYLLMVKLYHVIQGLKNPDDSRVEVAKL